MDGQESEPTDKKKTRLASRSTVYSQRPLWRLPEKMRVGEMVGKRSQAAELMVVPVASLLKVLSEAPPAWVTETLWKPLPGPVNLPRKHTGGHYKVVLIG